jgi:hypothetical protein
MNQPRPKPRLTICISTVRRTGLRESPKYLSQAVNRLLASMSAAERARVEIIIMNSNVPPEAHTEVEEVLRQHAAQAPHLLRSVAKAAPTFQPVSDSVGDRHLAWGKKLTLDFVNALRVCRQTNSEYILRLEDDVVAADHFVSYLLNCCERDGRDDKPWAFLSLFSLDWGPPHRLTPYFAYAAAILFPNDQLLDDLLDYLEKHHQRAPVDWLLAEYRDRAGRRGYVKHPSLFQHIGEVSSGITLHQRISPTFCPSCHPLRRALHYAVLTLRYMPLGLKFWLRGQEAAPAEIAPRSVQ